MISGNGRASNRLVVGRGTDAGSGGSMPHSRSWRGVSRRVPLFAGLGLAVALLATLVALLAPPLQAQTATVDLVHNRTNSGNNTATAQPVVAQQFTTGSDLGYTITEVRIRLATTGVTGRDITVRLKENNSSDEPGQLLATLTNPTALAPGDYNIFTVPDGGEIVEGNTSYWVTVNEGLTSSGARLRGWDDDDETSAYGWTITNNRLQRGISETSWATHAAPLIIQIRGTVRAASTDATLSDLSLGDASNGDAITLDPAFSSGHFDYSASVGFPVSRITVIPTKNDAGASIRYRNDSNVVLTDLDTSRPGLQVGLSEGAPNVIKVEMTAEDGVAEETYTLTVTRAARPGEVLLSEKVLSLTEGSGGYYSLVLNRQPASDVTVTVTRDAGVNMLLSPATLTFTPSNWQQPQWVFVSTGSDTNTTNESVRLTHTATSSDSLFDGITIPSVVVNVDDNDTLDRHIHTIRVPHGSHALPLGEKPLPEERIEVFLGLGVDEDDEDALVAKYLEVVAEGHVWGPSGLWGDPDDDTIWVVDPSHFGIHPLKLSALEQGRIEHLDPAGTNSHQGRFNYNCHFSRSRVGGSGNPALTVMWGNDNTIWVSNDEQGWLNAYSRFMSYGVRDGCNVENVTGYDSDGDASTTIMHLESIFHHVPDRDIQPVFPILGVFRLNGQPKRDDGMPDSRKSSSSMPSITGGLNGAPAGRFLDVSGWVGVPGRSRTWLRIRGIMGAVPTINRARPHVGARLRVVPPPGLPQRGLPPRTAPTRPALEGAVATAELGGLAGSHYESCRHSNRCAVHQAG